MTVKVPDSWNEVTIGQYMDIAGIDKDSEDKSILVASVLIDKDPEEIRKYDIQSYTRIIEALEWTNKIPDEVYKPIIEIDGDQYAFVNRLTDLTLGEWVDLEHYLQDYNNNIHKILAVLYRPLVTAFNDMDRIVEEYDPLTVDRRANLFMDKMSTSDVYGALVFFSIIAKECIVTIQDYLTQQIQNQMTKTLEENPKKKERFVFMRKRSKRNGLQNGIGTVLFTSWQREILQSLSRLRN